MPSTTTSLAQRLIEKIFSERHHSDLQEEVTFTRDDLISAATALGAARPKNLGDVVYSLRYRVPLPDSVRQTAPTGREWAIFPGGNAIYTMRFTPHRLHRARIAMGDPLRGLIQRRTARRAPQRRGLRQPPRSPPHTLPTVATSSRACPTTPTTPLPTFPRRLEDTQCPKGRRKDPGVNRCLTTRLNRGCAIAEVSMWGLLLRGGWWRRSGGRLLRRRRPGPRLWPTR